MIVRLCPLLAVTILLSACGTTRSQRSDGPSIANPSAEALRLRSFEKHFGLLPQHRTRLDLRDLKEHLHGLPLSAVRKKLGSPASVHVSGSTECWTYADIAYDSLSGRTVAGLDIWAEAGVVERISAQF